MSVFKKITSFLFEETENDVIAEDELEDVSFAKPLEESFVPDEPKTTWYEASQPLRAEADIPHSKPAVEAVTMTEAKKFVSIDFDEAPQKPSKRDHIEVRQPTPKKEEKREYVFTPVISPMFGAKEESKRKLSSAQPVHTEVRRMVKKKNNPLGTIISPYYGASELEEFEEAAQKDIELKELKRKEDICEVTPLPQESMEQQEEVKHISLAELLVDNQEEDSEDMMQISLFGDAAPIHEVEAGEMDDTETKEE